MDQAALGASSSGDKHDGLARLFIRAIIPKLVAPLARNNEIAEVKCDPRNKREPAPRSAQCRETDYSVAPLYRFVRFDALLSMRVASLASLLSSGWIRIDQSNESRSIAMPISQTERSSRIERETMLSRDQKPRPRILA
jgi:hypothetical protein